MNKKDLDKKIKEIANLIKDNKDLEASLEFYAVTEELYEAKKFVQIVYIFKKITNGLSNKQLFYNFETAYSFNENNNLDIAEEIYKYLLTNDEENVAILNNLSNIKKVKGEYKKSYDLIKVAYNLASQDETINRNYLELEKIITIENEKEQKFIGAAKNLLLENQFVIDKLKNFILNAKNDTDYSKGYIPIPSWKFKVLIGTND